MGALIKAIGFLIIGCTVVAFASIGALIVVAVAGGIFIGWLVTMPVRIKFRTWRNDRRTKVR